MELYDGQATLVGATPLRTLKQEEYYLLSRTIRGQGKRFKVEEKGWPKVRV